MAEAVVALVAEGIKPLGELIIQQGKFLSGVSYQVELAQVELHLMGAFLKDADSRTGDDQVVRIWVKLIKDVAYDLEDVIESFALKVAIRRRGGTVKIALKKFACIFHEGVHRYKIGSEIEDIMTKLSSLRSSLQSYNIRPSDPERVASVKFQKQRDQRLSYAHQVESHLVGLEESTAKLVKELVREEKRHRVVSIWGMGGSGKTTLAKQIFLQDEVKRHFDCCAWVCISQQCEGRDVLEEILVKLTSPPDEQRKQIAKMKKDEIAEKVCRIQREKKCLVVIDDIWTQEAWHSLKPGFPIHEETESRILLTTRKKEVASLASTNDFLHQPQPLNDEQSWELFEKIALCGSDHTELETNAKKRELGKKMLGHCSGLPLAISVLAGLLSRRDKIKEWKTVLSDVDRYIMRGKNVFVREKSGQEDGVSEVLALSYDDLPSQLKLCFLYLAQFPEDHEIPVKRLTQMWIAEGFITSGTEIHGSTEIMEDVAYGCLIELVERSMVQVGKCGGFSGKVKTCRLHDLMRDLCLQKAKEENFLNIVNFSMGLVSNTRLVGKARRLAIYWDKDDKYQLSTDGKDGHLRSLLFFTPNFFRQKWNKRVLLSVFNDFKLLRVLKLENLYSDFELPKTIGNLVHLRFLSLKDSAFRALPSSVSNLVLLQTLDLRSCGLDGRSCFGFTWGEVIKIRNVFWNMEQLRHLYLPLYGYYVSGGQKLSFARLCNLQTLVNIRAETCDMNDIVQLTNLRSLSLRAEYIPSDIYSRCPPNLYKLRLNGKMTELPKEPHLPNLTKLTLKNTRLKGDQIEILEKLPNLRVLFLGGESFESETLVFSQGGFPHLEVLTFSQLDDLKEWRVEKEAIRSLRRLRISWCSDLREVPDGLEDITILQELSIDWMPRRFCKRVEEGGEDFHKIKHVPSLIITYIRPDDKETEEAGGASEQAGDSHQESTTKEAIQAASTP